VLEVDGTMLSQSRAILNYVGKVTSLYPEDPFEGAKCEEFNDTVEDIVQICIAAAYGLDGDDKIAARKKIAAPGTKLHEWLERVDARLGANPSGFAVGTALSIVDLRIYCEFSAMVSGWFDGFPATILDKYENIQKHRAKIASLPKVEAHYAGASGMRSSFKPFDPSVPSAVVLEPCTKLDATGFFKTLDPMTPEATTITIAPGSTVVTHKSTYAANDPSEDRSTVAVGDDFIFTGVWDGHGGTPASEYSETKVFEYFQEKFDETGGDAGAAFTYAYHKTDATYLEGAKANNDARALFAGSCAVRHHCTSLQIAAYHMFVLLFAAAIPRPPVSVAAVAAAGVFCNNRSGMFSCSVVAGWCVRRPGDEEDHLWESGRQQSRPGPI
jgi:glutathione S-transferase